MTKRDQQPFQRPSPKRVKRCKSPEAGHTPNAPINTEGGERQVQLPDPAKNVSPDQYLREIVNATSGYTPKVRAALDLQGFFAKITEEQIEAYGIAIVTATREGDVDTLKAQYQSGHPVNCCNRFGESLLHMACRRGFTEIGRFLIEEASLNVRISDDCGRTPFHDICWHHTPNVELAEMVLRRDPTLLLISDKRGHTPFQYARQHDWPLWRRFLFDQVDLLKPLGYEDTKNAFS